MSLPAEAWWLDHVWNVLDVGARFVVGVFDADGRLTYANSGMRGFLGCGDGGLDPTRHLVSPTFETLNANRNDGAIFAGDIRAGMGRDPGRGIRAFVFRRGSEMLIVGDFDVEELDRANRKLADLDQEVNRLQRSLIDEQKKLEAATFEQEMAAADRRKNHQRIQDFAVSSSDWFWETDAEDRFTFLSDTAEDFSGRGALDRAIGRTRWELNGGTNDNDVWRQYCEIVSARQPIKDFQYDFRRSDGEVRVFRINGRPVFDDRGGFVGYRGTGRDVTEYRRQQSEREHNERLFLDAVVSIPVAFALFDENDRLILWNPLYGRMIAKGVNLVVGAKWEDILRRALAVGGIADAVGREEEWFRTRMEYHRSPVGALESIVDGRHVEVREHRTTDGKTMLMVRDVEEAKQAEAELQRQRDILAAIIEAVPVALYWKDESGRYQGCNEKFVVDRGIDGRDKVIGRTYRDLVSDPEDAARVEREDDAVIGLGKPMLNQEVRRIRSGGRKRVHLASKVPMRNSEGRIVGLVGTFMDISERIAAEEKVARQRNLLNAIVETLPLAVFWKDRAGIYQGCNKEFVERRELQSRDQVVGKTIRSFSLSAEEAIAVAEEDEAIMRTGRGAVGVEQTRLMPDGSKRTHLSSKMPIVDESGAVVGLVGAFLDITSRKAAERRLAESEERFRSIVGATSDGVIVADDHGHVVEWNAGAEKIFGFSASEIVGHSMSRIVPHHLRAAHKAGLEAAGRAGGTRLLNRTVEIDGVRKDGTEVPIELTIGRWVSDGHAFFSGIVRDIGERKQAEAFLRRSQKLQSLGNMAAGMAHEINNLLLPIMTLTSMTLKRLPAASAERPKLEKVVEAAKRAGVIIRQVMDFGRQDAGELREVDPRETVEAAIELIRSTLPSTVTLKHRLERNIGRIRVDPDQLRVALSNLAANAVDALAGRPGMLCVTLRRVEVDAGHASRMSGLEGGSYALIGVADTGIGMDAETRERAIDPFFTTKEVGEGTGLGLSIVHGFAERHGGALKIDSSPNEGTSIGIYLPLVGSGRAKPAPACGHDERNPTLISEMEKKYGTRSGDR